MRRVLVCGGRDYFNRKILFTRLDALHTEVPFGMLISGCASGADTLGELWAESRGVRVQRYPALWKKYGRSAGPKRNQQMLDLGQPNLVVAFPGGAGTAHMVRISKAANIEVLEIQP